MSDREEALRRILRAYLSGALSVDLKTEWAQGFQAGMKALDAKLTELETEYKLASSKREA